MSLGPDPLPSTLDVPSTLGLVALDSTPLVLCGLAPGPRSWFCHAPRQHCGAHCGEVQSNVPGQNRLLVGANSSRPTDPDPRGRCNSISGTQPEQLPGPLFRSVVMHLSCSVPLAQRDSPTLTQTSPEKMWTNSSTWEFLPRTTQTGPLHPTVPNFLVGPREGWTLVAVLLVALRPTIAH